MFSVKLLSRRALLLIPAGAALYGCASAPPPVPPTTLDLSIHPGANQNPDPQGNPAPVAVNIYQLATTGGFLGADVFALQNNAAAALGQDLLANESFVVAPNEPMKIHRELKTGAQFLGVAVMFRDIDHAMWRATAPLTLHAANALAVKIARLSVTLGPGS